MNVRTLQLIDSQLASEASRTVAFASDNRQSVNQHFGTASSFLIYQLINHTWHLSEVIEFEIIQTNHSSDKIKQRIELLSHCEAVFCIAMGPAAMRQSLRQHIKPIVVSHGENIRALLNRYETQTEPVVTKRTMATGSTEKKETDLTNLLQENW